MKYSTEREHELTEKLLKIFTQCMLRLFETKDLKYSEEWYFMEEVFNAHLIEGDKQLFLLGALAQKVHDGGPEAFKRTAKMMGMWKEDNL